MLGLFIAGLALSTLVAGVSFFAQPPTPTPPDGPAARSAPVGLGRRAGSVRFWALQLAGFGAVGAALVVAGVAGPVALVVATVTSGLVAGWVDPLLEEASGDVEFGWLAGAAGRVVLPIGRGASTAQGKVAILTERGRIELPARSADGRPIDRGVPVLVAFVEDGRATVEAFRGRGPAPH